MNTRRMTSRFALAVAVGQPARDALRVRLAVSGAQQAALDFATGAARCVAVEARAAEEIDLLQLREQAGTGVAARSAGHLVDGEALAGLKPVGENACR
jgi:hypothetical protein